MDDIIVIILTLIFIVASIFGQKKKKPPVQQTEHQPAGDSFWDMLDKEYRKVSQPAESPWATPKEEMPESAHSEEPQHYKFKPENEGARITVPKPEVIQPVVSKTKKKKFPLREAVIYSEILNRKYT